MSANLSFEPATVAAARAFAEAEIAPLSRSMDQTDEFPTALFEKIAARGY
jgi:hypothetical protein